jgi:ABC-type microcin C transport system permease subunit YejE
MKVLEDGVSCVCNAGEVVAKIVYGFRKDVEKSIFSLTTHAAVRGTHFGSYMFNP